jgi:hypothetical protein
MRKDAGGKSDRVSINVKVQTNAAPVAAAQSPTANRFDIEGMSILAPI